MNMLANHNAARLYETGHKLTKTMAAEYESGKKLDKYLKDQETIEVFNRAGTTVAAVVDHIKATVKVKVTKEQDDA